MLPYILIILIHQLAAGRLDDTDFLLRQSHIDCKADWHNGRTAD